MLTGALPDLTREQATERITAAGGRVTGSVSRKTDWLVAGEGGGSKRANAERLGVPVIDEAGPAGADRARAAPGRRLGRRSGRRRQLPTCRTRSGAPRRAPR